MGAGLIAGGAAVGGLSLFAGETSSANAEREVAEVISSYGRSVEVTKKGEQSIEHRVKMRGIDQFVKTFDPKQLPFEKIQVCEGNVLRFSHGGVDFTLVNVA